MGEVIYKPLIEDMTWSFSRVEAYDDCPYRWYLRYICRCEEKDQFYSSYGSFMHKLLEEFYKGSIPKEELPLLFLKNFRNEVRGIRPKSQIVESYIQSGKQFLETFTPFPYNPLAIEERVNFEIDGIPFTGFIDYLGEYNGDYIIIDHKSRSLKPRSGKKTPTAKDKELDEMLKQLYLYAGAVKQIYGKFPKYLCFNCFRNGMFICEPFNEETYHETVNWVKERIAEIENSEEFTPHEDFFSCFYLCGVNEFCDTFKERRSKKNENG